MERHRRIAALWNWLPAFRGVAELESVHKAAVELAVSPSALSRSVRLLEEAVGRPLFFREGAGLRLTPFGRDLFLATKEAIRRVDDAVSMADVGAPQQVTIGASSPILLAIAEAATLAALEAGVGARVRTRLLPEEESASELLRGAVDLVVGYRAERHAELVSEQVGVARYATFYSESGDATRDAASRPLVFVAGQALSTERASLEVSSVGSAVDAVRAIDGYCVLPDVELACVKGMRKVAQGSALDPVHATWRRPVSEGAMAGLAELVTSLRRLLSR